MAETNADRIRAMSDEELAKYLMKDGTRCPPIDCPEDFRCEDCWLDWLKRENVPTT